MPLPPPLPTSTRRRSRSSPPPSCVRWSVWCCCGWWTSTGWTTSTPCTDLRQGIGLRAYGSDTTRIIAYKQGVSGDVRGDDLRHSGGNRPAGCTPYGCGRTRRSSGSVWPRPRRRASGGDGTVKKQPTQGEEDRPQRSLPLRQRQEVQELLRPGCVKIPGQEDCHGIS